MRSAILDGVATTVPAARTIAANGDASREVKAGVIVAWGQTDINDPSSELHERHAVGPRTHGRYHSVDPGKLTMAPYFASLLADRIGAIG